MGQPGRPTAEMGRGPRALAPDVDAGAPPAGAGPSRPDARQEILRRAEAMGIPWERILLDELQAEQTLRRYSEDAAEMPLAAQMSLLTTSLLNSWRVRDRLQALSCAAQGAAAPDAVRALRAVFRRFTGRPEPGASLLAGHLGLAYQRVLLLQRVCHAARKSRGTTAERMAFVCATARCGFDDAAWAVCREDAPRPGHRLDAAMERVREEGFQIPRHATEARAFAELRRIAHASPATLRRRRRARAPQDAVASPSRVGLR